MNDFFSGFPELYEQMSQIDDLYIASTVVFFLAYFILFALFYVYIADVTYMKKCHYFNEKNWFNCLRKAAWLGLAIAAISYLITYWAFVDKWSNEQFYTVWIGSFICAFFISSICFILFFLGIIFYRQIM